MAKSINQKKRKQWHRFIFGTLLFVMIFFGSLLFAIYQYIQTNHFRELLNRSVVQITGQQIDLADKIVINRLFPNISISLPDAKVKTTDNSLGYERLRIAGLNLSFSPEILLSRMQHGHMTLSLERLSVIVSARSKDSDAAKTAMPFSRNLAELMERLEALELTVKVGQLDYIQRDTQSQHFKTSNVALSVNQDSIKLSMAYHSDTDRIVDLEVELTGLDVSSDEIGSVSANLHARLLPGGEQIAAVAIESKLRIEADTISLNDLELDHAFTKVRGNVRIEPFADTTKIRGKLALRKIELANFVSKKNTTPTRLFSNDFLDLSGLENLDVDIALELGAVRYKNHPIVNGTVKVRINHQGLKIQADDLSVLNGDTRFTFSVSNMSSTPEVRIKINTNNLKLTRLHIDESTTAALTRGEADLMVSLKGSGRSIATIARSLRGYIKLAIADTQISNQYAKLIDKGLISWTGKQLFKRPNGKPRQATEATSIKTLPILCASLNVNINNGVMIIHDGLIIDFPENTLYGSGFVDLSTEAIGFVFNADKKRFFEWSAISTIKYIEIAGTMLKPLVTYNAKETMKKGLLTASSFILGPIPSLAYAAVQVATKNRNKPHCMSSIY